MTVAYEWYITRSDGVDIVECDHAATYRGAKFIAACMGTGSISIELQRDSGLDDAMAFHREYATVEKGALPQSFPDGSRIPARFHAEVRKVEEAA